MRNRFKGLDLIDRMFDELWTEVHPLYGRQGSRPSLRKKYAKSQNGSLRRALQRVVKRTQKQRRKGETYPFEGRVPKNSEER